LGIAHERLDRAKTAHLVQDLVAQDVAVALAERRGLLVDQLGDDRLELGRRAIEVHAAERVEIEALEQLAMDAELQVLVGPGGAPGSRRGRGGAPRRAAHGCGWARSGRGASWRGRPLAEDAAQERATLGAGRSDPGDFGGELLQREAQADGTAAVERHAGIGG